MTSKENLLMQIEKSLILNKELKKNLILYFDILTEKQKNTLVEVLKNERKIALEYLKTLKNSWVITFEEIKNNIEQLHRKKRQKSELEENKYKHKELEELLSHFN